MPPRKPDCAIDFRQPFSLPIGVAPASLSDANRNLYTLELDAGASLLKSTHGEYYAGTEETLHVATRDTAAGPGTVVIVPRGTPGAANAALTAPQIAAVRQGAAVFALQPIAAAADSAAVADEIYKKVFRDDDARSISAIAAPLARIDTFRFYFPHKVAPGFPGTLGLAIDGVLPVNGFAPPAVPEFLLQTGENPAHEIGELDRLLLRSPVLGVARFEPYFHYQRTGAVVSVAGSSNAGRLVVKSSFVAAQNDRRDTHLYRDWTFVFENVDREAVRTLLYQRLLFLILSFPAIRRATTNQAGHEPRLRFANDQAAVFSTLQRAVHKAIATWIAYLGFFPVSAGDQAVRGALPAEWTNWFFRDPVRADRLQTVTAAIESSPDRIISLQTFLSRIYAPLLSGYSWHEVLQAEALPAAFFMPVPGNRPPKTPAAPAELAKVKILEAALNSSLHWLPCWAGCPVGRPSAVYADAAAGTNYPANALTAYELEALHFAGVAGTVLAGVAAAAASAGPQRGVAMDLTPYAAKRLGYASLFYAFDRQDALRSAADWLIELTQEMNVRVTAEPELDLPAFYDLAAREGHPLFDPLRADDYRRAHSIRRQMDVINATGLEAASRAWWLANLHMVTVGDEWELDDPIIAAAGMVPIGGRNPMQQARTVFPRLVGKVGFDARELSGLDVFDIQAALLARSRMKNVLTGAHDLPLPVILALMRTEGVSLHAFVNRLITNTRVAADTLTWEAWFEDLATPGVMPSGRRLARQFWLLWPYGLDSFSQRFDQSRDILIADGVFTPGAQEDLSDYLEKRIFARWDVSPLDPTQGRPNIWKLARRVHWMIVSLMVGWYQARQSRVHAPTVANGFREAVWVPSAAWLPAVSPPVLPVGAGPNDPAWRELITYYGLIYLSYNAAPSYWVSMIKNAEATAGARNLRDHLIFFDRRKFRGTQNAARFCMNLDNYLRLDTLEMAAWETYDAAMPIVTPLARAVVP